MMHPARNNGLQGLPATDLLSGKKFEIAITLARGSRCGRRSLASAEWRGVQGKIIESRGIRITGLMQGNVRYMQFSYEWFARSKDSCLD